MCVLGLFAFLFLERGSGVTPSPDQALLSEMTPDSALETIGDAKPWPMCCHSSPILYLFIFLTVGKLIVDKQESSVESGRFCSHLDIFVCYLDFSIRQAMMFNKLSSSEDVSFIIL